MQTPIPPFLPPLAPSNGAPDPAVLSRWLAAGATALQAADWLLALQAYRQAADCAPLAHEAYDGMAGALEGLGLGSDGLACRMAALALQNGSALDLYNLGTAYLMTGHLPQAEAWYRLALRVDPALVLAHRNLAAVLRDTGRSDAAQFHQDAAYRRQHCFDNGLEAAPVLLLCAAGRGNVPLDLWFAPQATRRIEYMIEYAPASADRALLAALPDGTVIFNAIGDADVARPTLARLRAFAAGAGRAVLNAPDAVAGSARDSLPEVLAGVPGLVVPPVWRLTPAQARATLSRQLVDEPGAGWLVRPVATHGGEGLVRVETQEDLAALTWPAAAECYVTRFHDFRSADGYFRKYRMIFIAGRPYPYHLAISDHWLVHYFSADMLAHPWKQAEELRFLTDPGAVLGAPAMAALSAVGGRLGLDYAGMDFSLLPDGRVLMFEANATMLVHAEPQGSALTYKNPFIEVLREAFAAMVVRHRA